MTTPPPNNLPPSIGVPGGAPNDILGVSMLLTQFSQSVNSWVGSAANAVNYLLGLGGYVSSTVPSPGVSLVSNTAANVTSVMLSAGDWDITGNVYFVQSVANIITAAIAVISGTSASVPTNTLGVAGFTQILGTPSSTGVRLILPISPLRVTPTVTTPYYLVAQATFGSGSITAYGTIQARRWR